MKVGSVATAIIHVILLLEKSGHAEPIKTNCKSYTWVESTMGSSS